jgi:hypothetical protein
MITVEYKGGEKRKPPEKFGRLSSAWHRYTCGITIYGGKAAKTTGSRMAH